MKKLVLRQTVRFTVVGFFSNVALYILYYFLVSVKIHYMSAMTLAYMVGVCQTFFFNKIWTFGYLGQGQRAFLKYCLLYLCGYIFSVLSLYIFVEKLGYSHYFIQAMSIVAVAVLTFLLQKFWVFSSE